MYMSVSFSLALKFYDVKGYGFCEVQQLYGQETMHKAAEQLKSLYGGKGQKRFRLFISVKAVVLYDYSTWVRILKNNQLRSLPPSSAEPLCHCQDVNHFFLFP